MSLPLTDESNMKNQFEKAAKKARLKTTKAVKQTLSSANTLDDVSTKEHSLDKDHSSNIYIGFQAETIKLIWEQFDDSEKEVIPEVYGALAEDVSYKMWDIIHAVNTYGKHSGGFVTCEVVNEVLKDCDEHPILGLDNKDSWNKAQYSGNFYFRKDEEKVLREEYLSPKSFRGVPFSEILTCWTTDDGKLKALRNFSCTMCAAIFLGDEKSYELGLEIALASPQINCVLKIIFRKCLEMLLWEQKQPIIERCVQFFRVLTFNINLYMVDLQKQYSHFAEIFTSLIMYPNKKINAAFENNLDNNKMNYNHGLNENQIHIVDNVSSCDVIFQILPNEIRKIVSKSETEEASYLGPSNELKIKDSDRDQVSKTIKRRSLKECYPSLENSNMAVGNHLDNLYSAMGDLASNFTCFKNECAKIFIDWIKYFFKSQIICNQDDFIRFCRVIRGSLVLGDCAFRELTSVSAIVGFTNLPESVHNFLNIGAVYLLGRQDTFLYQRLQEICGDMMQPFMLFFHTNKKFLQSVSAKSDFSFITKNIEMYPKLQVDSLKTQLNFLCEPEVWFQVPISTCANWEQMQFRYFDSCFLETKSLEKNSEEQSQQISVRIPKRNVLISRKILLTRKKKTEQKLYLCFNQI